MTPDDLANQSEHSQQNALFCWAACAALYGFDFANDNRAYFLSSRDDLHKSFRPYEIPALKRLHAIHNQGHGDQIRGARAKAEGVRSGVPDIFLPVPKWGVNRPNYAGLYIELKQEKYRTRKNGGCSDKQLDWIAYLRGAGYRVEVAYGWREAANFITNYLK